MKLLFAGTPEFAATALAALLLSPHPVLAVYTQPDRPAGRGRKLQASPVKQLATAYGLAVFQPDTLRNQDEQARLRDFAADVLVVAAYGLILPQAVLRAPRLGCINIHASLLPRWRGAAPIQRAILAGDHETGITIMQMERRLDSGPMFLQRVCPILPTDDAETLHTRLATLGAHAIVEVLDGLTQGALSTQPQDESQATYAAKSNLDWHRSAQELARQIRAFNPYPVAQTHADQAIVRVWQATVVACEATYLAPLVRTPGTILAANRAGVSVATGDGILVLRKVQLPGGRVLDIADVLNAHSHPFPPGRVLY